MKSLLKLCAIIRVSMLETLGRPIALLLTFASAIWILMLPMLQFQRFSEDGRLARDCGLATMFLFGLIFVIGNASRFTHTLTNGTAAAVFVKPITRGLWILGHCLGGIFATLLFLLVQLATIVLAETFSPTYQINGQYADVYALIYSMGLLVVPLILGALNQLFFHGRFVLTAVLSLPILMWVEVFWVDVIHIWGIFSGGILIFFGLIQIAAIAMAFAVRCSAGLTTILSSVFVLFWMYCLNGSAYFQLDALSQGGAISGRVILHLLPQTLVVMAFALWSAIGLLNNREVS